MGDVERKKVARDAHLRSFRFVFSCLSCVSQASDSISHIFFIVILKLGKWNDEETKEDGNERNRTSRRRRVECRSAAFIPILLFFLLLHSLRLLHLSTLSFKSFSHSHLLFSPLSSLFPSLFCPSLPIPPSLPSFLRSKKKHHQRFMLETKTHIESSRVVKKKETTNRTRKKEKTKRKSKEERESSTFLYLELSIQNEVGSLWYSQK